MKQFKFMLGQFTWGQFLCCYGAVSLLWYLGLLFTAYREEALALLGLGVDGDSEGSVLKFRSQDNPLNADKPGFRPVQSKDFSNDTTRLSDNESVVKESGADREPGSNMVKSKQCDGEIMENDLMGKVKPPLGLEKLETTNLSFAVPSKDGLDEEGEDSEDGGGGLYEDLVGSIREIYQILAANDGNKQDFFGMVSELKGQFGPLGSSPCIVRVNAYIRDSAPFSISNEELENLWD